MVKEADWEKKKTGEERKKKERKRKRGNEREEKKEREREREKKRNKERRGENGLRLAGTQADLSVALSLVTVLLVHFFSSTAS